MGDRKPIGVAYRDQDIDGGEIGRNDPQLVRGKAKKNPNMAY